MAVPFVYKRINHFTERLRELTTDSHTIPDDIVEAVRGVLHHNHTELTKPVQVREALKQLGQPKYYEHSGRIFTSITGIPTNINLSDDQRDTIVAHFKMVNDSYNTALNNVGLQRLNFLNYNYITVKLTQLLGIPDADKIITIPFGMSCNLERHDTIWAEIRRLNKWPNISFIELQELKRSLAHTIYCLNKWANDQGIVLQQSWIETINKLHFAGIYNY